MSAWSLVALKEEEKFATGLKKKHIIKKKVCFVNHKIFWIEFLIDKKNLLLISTSCWQHCSCRVLSSSRPSLIVNATLCSFFLLTIWPLSAREQKRTDAKCRIMQSAAMMAGWEWLSGVFMATSWRWRRRAPLGGWRFCWFICDSLTQPANALEDFAPTFALQPEMKSWSPSSQHSTSRKHLNMHNIICPTSRRCQNSG